MPVEDGRGLRRPLPDDERAERLGWLDSVDQWLDVRRQRNRMIHEYVRDPAALAAALEAANAAVPLLLRAAGAMSGLVLTPESGG